MLYKIIAIAIVSIILINLINATRPDFALPITIAAGLTMLKIISGEIQIARLGFIEMASELNIDSEITATCFKLCLISVAKNLICDLCKDYGNSFIADKVDLASRIAMLTLCFPWIKQLIVYINKLL